jgi:Uma2 family endonuclease
MGQPRLKTKVSVAEYLEHEKDGDVRSEFIAGDVYAMAGASDRHQYICSNLFVSLFTHLRDSESCRVFMSDMKLKAADDRFYYPDVMVACDQNPRDPFFREEPVLIIEVASPTTRATDRREKLQAYQQLPSVIEYLLVEQDRMHAELNRRQPNGSWVTYLYSSSESDESISFASVGFEMSLQEIYDRVGLGNS